MLFTHKFIRFFLLSFTVKKIELESKKARKDFSGIFKNSENINPFVVLSPLSIPNHSSSSVVINSDEDDEEEDIDDTDTMLETSTANGNVI